MPGRTSGPRLASTSGVNPTGCSRNGPAPQEQKILLHTAEEMTSRQIAKPLNVSVKRVAICRLRAMKALGAANLAKQVRLWVALRLVKNIDGEDYSC